MIVQDHTDSNKTAKISIQLALVLHATCFLLSILPSQLPRGGENNITMHMQIREKHLTYLMDTV